MIACAVDRDNPYVGWRLPRPQQKFQYYRFEVCLEGVEPKIFRTFSLPADASFFDLHTAIQVACGWWDCHNYVFQNEYAETLAKPCTSVGAEEPPDNTDDDAPDDTALKLSTYFQEGHVQKCFYLYDSQNLWLHTITLQRTFTDERSFARELLDGAGAFPPENCRGVQEYTELITLKETGAIPDAVDWEDAVNIIELIEDWDPHAFNLDDAKAAFDLFDGSAYSRLP
jgi:hypothetical protein